MGVGSCFPVPTPGPNLLGKRPMQAKVQSCFKRDRTQGARLMVRPTMSVEIVYNKNFILSRIQAKILHLGYVRAFQMRLALRCLKDPKNCAL